jgi:hypothetical protein
MKRVYKYTFEIDDEITIPMPPGDILSVQVQRGRPCVWALVDPKAPLIERRFRIAGTGHDIDNADQLTFRGTFQLRDGALVFHLFEYMP